LAASGLRLGETIVAIATAPGRGAIALVRICGSQAFELAAKHIKPWPLSARTATHCGIVNGPELLDDAVVTTYPAPHSFTGDDVVEISTHGGYAVPASVVAAFVQSGARPAMPGEFTRRAVLNGKLDLIQAEGIGELVGAQSAAMQRAALAQLRGGLSKKLNALRSSILALEALVAYDVDFPGEDDGPVPEADVTAAAREIERSLEDLLATASFGRVIRQGASVVIAGPPNAGKSSLFNAMLGNARAIVTDIPGTTRDALEAVVDTGDWMLRLVDTAGLRQTEDTIEKLGIEVSEEYLRTADIALACADTLEATEETASRLRALTEAPILRIWTKADLRPNASPDANAVSVSAETRSGLGELFSGIAAELSGSYGRHNSEEPVVTTARQHAALTRALNEVRSFERVRASGSAPTTIAAVHLREATTALEDLIGAVDVEDVLTKLFSTFCIGK
jgi:tRNA modification GTPase